MSADKMFEELGYVKTKKGYDELNYKKECRQWRENGEILLNFNLKHKMVDILFSGVTSGNLPAFLTAKELKAINKKCEELEWI